MKSKLEHVKSFELHLTLNDLELSQIHANARNFNPNSGSFILNSAICTILDAAQELALTRGGENANDTNTYKNKIA